MPGLITIQRLSRAEISPSSSSCNWSFLFQWTLFAMILLLPLTHASPTPELPSDDLDLVKRSSTNFAEKRNWQSLQGAWGKRSSLDADLSAELNEADDDVYFAERRIPLLPDSVERAAAAATAASSPVLKYSLVYLKNAGGILDHLANGDYELAPDARKFDNNLTQYDMEPLENNDLIDGLPNDKRAWKSMNVAWGKRRNAPQWNKFRGAWGKREPGWNNLKGMWGKRSSKDWQKLHGSWGKRSKSADNAAAGNAAAVMDTN